MTDMRLRTQRGFPMGTMMSTIKVPDVLRLKRTTGIEWFDNALGGAGGFTPTTTMMLTGGPGTGKSTFFRQLADSMSGAGHIVVYNCGEESLLQVKMACERLNLKNDFMVAEETMLPKLLTFMDTVKVAHPNKQIILLQDSLATIDDGKYIDSQGNSRGTTGVTPLRCTEMMVDWTQQNFAITMFIGQVTKSDVFSGKNGIRHAIDAHAHLFIDEKERSDTFGHLLFEMSKNRFGANGMTYILNLSNNGIEEHGSFKKVAGSP